MSLRSDIAVSTPAMLWRERCRYEPYNQSDVGYPNMHGDLRHEDLPGKDCLLNYASSQYPEIIGSAES